MNTILLLCLVPALLRSPVPPSSSVPFEEPTGQGETGQEQAGFEERFNAAGDDVAALWNLHEWCRSEHKYAESRKTLKRLIELDPDHAEARSALGHTFYDGQWFESSYKLSEHKRAEEKRKLEEEGLVRLGDEWVPKDEVVFRRMGWVRLDDGQWVGRLEAKRREEAARLSAQNWKQQTDLVWIAPEEQAKWQDKLWKCGDRWLSTEEANQHHSSVQTAWRWPSQHFVLYSTLDNDGLAWAAWWADQVYADCQRAYGLHLKTKPTVTVLRDSAQYNAMALADQATGRPPTESNGFSSCHYAYVGECWFDTRQADPSDLLATTEYLGGGICYWDRKDPALEPWGKFAVRHAAALSFAESLDPSWDAVSKFVAAPNGTGEMGGFWAEKRIPRWFRFGVAAYCERFFKDPQPPEGYQAWWVRDWALDTLRKAGGARPLEQVFAFNLDPNDQPGSTKLISEAGMIVSFVLDGECPAVKEKHAAFKVALRDGGDTQAAIDELQKAIVANDEPYRLHIGM